MTIFAPGDQDLKFNHGVVLLPCAGRLGPIGSYAKSVLAGVWLSIAYGTN